MSPPGADHGATLVRLKVRTSIAPQMRIGLETRKKIAEANSKREITSPVEVA
jgi:hypothetical protein